MGESRPPCILVVEDHPETLTAILRLLAHNGFTAYGAGTCAEALEVFARQRCPVLVCDIVLPDGSGLDLMRELRRLGVRGVAVSAYAAREDREASLRAGFVAHLAKPMHLTELLDAIQRLIPSQ